MSDGIAETIINNLAQLERLRVIPRTTAFRYKGKLLDPAQVGRELRARVVLTGRVVQRGERLVVGAELIDTVHESQLWGRTIDRRIEDILSIQVDIAAEISNSLHLQLTDVEKKRLRRRPTESRDAYHLYLKTMYFANQWTAEGVRKGFEYCRQAIDADPIYAEAYTGLAYLYVLAGIFGGAPPVEAFAKAKASAVKALEIDDGIARAHAMLGSSGSSMSGTGRGRGQSYDARLNWLRIWRPVITHTAIGTYLSNALRRLYPKPMWRSILTRYL